MCAWTFHLAEGNTLTTYTSSLRSGPEVLQVSSSMAASPSVGFKLKILVFPKLEIICLEIDCLSRELLVAKMHEATSGKTGVNNTDVVCSLLIDFESVQRHCHNLT